MGDKRNYKNFIANVRGLALIWVVACPLAIGLYDNFPETSITIIAIAIVLSTLVNIVFPYLKEKTIERSEATDTLADDEKPVSVLYTILSKVDRFIFVFMYHMAGTFLVVVGNMFAFGAMARVSKSSDRTPDPTVQLIFLGMVCSWFILWFFRWYMKKFHPDFHD